MKQEKTTLTKEELEVELIKLCEEEKITYEDILFKKIFIIPNDEQLEIVELDFKNKNPNFIISFDGNEEIINFVKDTGIPYEILPSEDGKYWENIIIEYMKNLKK